jgi:hypothetical protein
MTKIYTYCLFDGDYNFHGVYSSLSSVYRDAVKLANKGQSKVRMRTDDGWQDPSLTTLRNMLYGKCDVIVILQSGSHKARILKTKLKE